MTVGTLEIHLRLQGIESLKDKRKVIRSLMERTRNEFHVSIAEVADQDLWGNASIGVAMVSNDPGLVESVLQSVLNRFDSHPEVEVDWVATEIRPAGA